MFILENVPLSGYSTMRLGGPARYLTEVSNRNEVVEAVDWAEQKQLPVIMIGTGSNIVWKDEGFPGLVIVNRILRFESFNEDNENLYITVGGGENWDEVVRRCAESGASGVEQLSLIPGTAGATPVQNVGAYGREISEVLVTVETYDTQTKQFITIPSGDCGFGYRTSKFKTTERGRYFITAITLHLTKLLPKPPFYAALQDYLDQNNITTYSPQVIRDAVIAIRTAKLPDPNIVANNGSFFANPIIDQATLNNLLQDYPELTYWPLDDRRIKVSAAWLVEKAGFKGVHDAETGMATWPKQALVMVNENAVQTAQLLAFKQKIVAAVQTKFGITLEQEPELLP